MQMRVFHAQHFLHSAYMAQHVTLQQFAAMYVAAWPCHLSSTSMVSAIVKLAAETEKDAGDKVQLVSASCHQGMS
jgi:hypothetical protein